MAARLPRLTFIVCIVDKDHSINARCSGLVQNPPATPTTLYGIAYTLARHENENFRQSMVSNFSQMGRSQLLNPLELSPSTTSAGCNNASGTRFWNQL